ncbi:MAG TPA: hypothetical protein VFY25_13445 [Anaerolineales bacterium]|nr:hypothetical protein [Anaerolineales bacterium]
MRNIPNEKQIEELLEELSPQLSRRLDERLSSAPWMLQSNKQGERMNLTQPRRLSRLAFATFMIIALLSLAFVTPQGRAFAQSILQFFTRAESNRFPLQPSQLPVNPSDPAIPTAEPPAPLVSVAEAEMQADFDAAELPLVPNGFNYLGARLYGNAISIEYEAQGGGGNLIIMQSKDGFLQSDWDKVPAEAVIPVKIGELNGEFTQGTFVVPAGETSAVWNPSAPILRLRWMQAGVWVEMTKFGDVEAIEYLDQNGMIELAERLTTDVFPLEIKEAESVAGFDILEPTWIPEILSFKGAAFESKEWSRQQNTVRIFYSLRADLFGPGFETNGVILTQQPIESVEDCEICDFVGADANVEQVQIEDTPGEYVVGVWKADDAGNWVWAYEPWLQTLRWQENGIAFELLYMGPPEAITKANLIAIAESLQ